MKIPRVHWDQLVAHARETTPEECCGYLWSSGGVVEGVAASANDYESPRYGYRLDAPSMLAAFKRSEQDGIQVGSYHSHPRSPAEPSQTDINLAGDWPDWLYVIVSLDGEPTVRAWWLREGKVDEEPLEIT